MGSDAFAERIRRLLGDRPADADLPQRATLRARPSLEEIVRVVCRQFGAVSEGWSAASRCDDISRAVAAYLARRQYGYPAGEVARALGYRGHSSVSTAVSRIESGTDAVRRTVASLVRELTND